jgi:2-dehydro-3-deoxygalactonokinase
MDTILCCDWGTSSLRLRLADTTNLEIISGENSSQGIASTFAHWQQHTKGPHDRVSYFLQVIERSVRDLEGKTGYSFRGIPIIISGMAASSIGVSELPYADMPFAIDGTSLVPYTVDTPSHFEHSLFLVSGVRDRFEVMRGEETQLIGCIDGPDAEGLFIFPGTHSKHVIVEGDQAVSIRTFMTGEFFALLADKSILHASVVKHDQFHADIHMNRFLSGVSASEGNILSTAFSVRTNDVLQKMGKKENYSYLSGLLIGGELRGSISALHSRVTICGESSLTQLYTLALRKLVQTATIKTKAPDEAFVKGQIRIFNHSKLLQ